MPTSVPGRRNGVLRVDRLEVSYGSVRALRGVSLTVDQGQFVGVVGPNGAGKSTLLLTIAGALAPSAGTIQLEGAFIAGVAAENIARLIHGFTGGHGFPVVQTQLWETPHCFATYRPAQKKEPE